MKLNNRKLLLRSLSAIVIIFFNFSAFASNVDTTKLLALAAKNTVTEVTVTKPSNINYPLSLEKNREQSIDYVEKVSNKKRDYLIHTYSKGKNYFPKVAAILKRYNLPQELKVLIALESGFNPNALSGAGAVGYWQIMDAVAQEYGLTISNAEKEKTKNKIRDDRKNLLKSTVAAAKYLKDRCLNLNNDLLLMVASYNCGVGKVRSAINKSGKSNADFWDIKKYLPAETRNYVMNFIALNVLFNNYEKFANKTLLFTPIQQKIQIAVPVPEESDITL